MTLQIDPDSIGNRRILHAAVTQRLHDDDMYQAMGEHLVNGIRRLVADNRSQIERDARPPRRGPRAQRVAGASQQAETKIYDVERILSDRSRQDGSGEYLVQWGRRPEGQPHWLWVRQGNEILTPRTLAEWQRALEGGERVTDRIVSVIDRYIAEFFLYANERTAVLAELVEMPESEMGVIEDILARGEWDGETVYLVVSRLPNGTFIRRVTENGRPFRFDRHEDMINHLDNGYVYHDEAVDEEREYIQQQMYENAQIQAFVERERVRARAEVPIGGNITASQEPIWLTSDSAPGIKAATIVQLQTMFRRAGFPQLDDEAARFLLEAEATNWEPRVVYDRWQANQPPVQSIERNDAAEASTEGKADQGAATEGSSEEGERKPSTGQTPTKASEAIPDDQRSPDYARSPSPPTPPAVREARQRQEEEHRRKQAELRAIEEPAERHSKYTEVYLEVFEEDVQGFLSRRQRRPAPNPAQGWENASRFENHLVSMRFIAWQAPTVAPPTQGENPEDPIIIDDDEPVQDGQATEASPRPAKRRRLNNRNAARATAPPAQAHRPHTRSMGPPTQSGHHMNLRPRRTLAPPQPASQAPPAQPTHTRRGQKPSNTTTTNASSGPGTTRRHRKPITTKGKPRSTAGVTKKTRAKKPTTRRPQTQIQTQTPIRAQPQPQPQIRNPNHTRVQTRS